MIEGPVTDDVSAQCEQVLRSLPGWFGVEASLLQYVRDTATLPTFVARDAGEVVAFLSLREHFAETWEVHCIAVRASHRRRGLGRALHAHVEGWLSARAARVLQVKTVGAGHLSPEYAETRRFYAHRLLTKCSRRPGLPVLISTEPLLGHALRRGLVQQQAREQARDVGARPGVQRLGQPDAPLAHHLDGAHGVAAVHVVADGRGAR